MCTLDGTKYQGHFGMDQMSPLVFAQKQMSCKSVLADISSSLWRGPNVLVDILDRTRSLARLSTWIPGWHQCLIMVLQDNPIFLYLQVTYLFFLLENFKLFLYWKFTFHQHTPRTPHFIHFAYNIFFIL